MICDPSHICGNRSFLSSVAQEAVDLLFDGLMIEVHKDPDSAMSDKDQQLTPSAYTDLINNLKFKTESSDNDEFLSAITHLRGEINKLDSTFIELLGERMVLAEEIGECKRANDVSVLQPSRWAEILETRVAQGKMKNLSENFITKLYQLMHEEAIRHQEGGL
jgi:chorismate mutase